MEDIGRALGRRQPPQGTWRLFVPGNRMIWFGWTRAKMAQIWKQPFQIDGLSLLEV